MSTAGRQIACFRPCNTGPAKKRNKGSLSLLRYEKAFPAAPAAAVVSAQPEGGSGPPSPERPVTRPAIDPAATRRSDLLEASV